MIEMSQADIIKVLKKAKKPLTVREIAEKLSISEASVGRSLRMMIRFGEVKIAGTISRGKHTKCVNTYTLVKRK